MVERKLDELVFILDRLGPATTEQVAEVKAVRKAAQRKAIRGAASFVVLMLVGAVLIGVGSVVGNRLDVDVTDLWPTSVPSGERAEPEEGAR